MEAYRTPGRPDSGFIFDRNGQAIEIDYQVHDGLAIWQGDIIVGRADEIANSVDELLERNRPERTDLARARGAYINGFTFRWVAGVVPYEIDGSLPNQSRVINAISIVERQTPGVTFVPRSGQADYVRFVPEVGDACLSSVGRVGGLQHIRLTDDCDAGNTVHEIGHALGMFHEHSRCDRDTYVTINLANIDNEWWDQFYRHCTDATDDGPYDEGSIMHYGPKAFSNNDQPTIVSLRGRDADMGQRNGMGPSDVQTIRLLYGAYNQPPTAHIASLNATYPVGVAVHLDGSGSSDPDDSHLEYSWSFGDGTCSVNPTPFECMSPNPSHVYSDEGTYDVRLLVRDGFLKDVATAIVTVVNAPPVVDAGADATLDEGAVFAQSGTVSDPGDGLSHATVDYGDGTGSQPLTFGAGGTFNLSHAFGDNGVYTVTVEYTDDGGQVGSDDVLVTVNNVAPTVDAGPDATVLSGDSYAFSGSFADPGVVDAPWSYVVGWGLGADLVGGVYSQHQPITDTRVFCAVGGRTIQMTVTDKDGLSGSDAAMITVEPKVIALDITPGGDPNPVNLRSRGVLPVAILGSATFDVTRVDVSALTLGNRRGPEASVAENPDGSYQASTEDVNSDGVPDLVAKFSVPDLVANGDLTEASSSLTVGGLLADGCTVFTGEDAVLPRP